MSEPFDVAVVGGGILGLAFAAEAARRGKSVILCERDRQAQGASIRNFGMVWPIGQPPGPLHGIAMKSRDRWLELAAAGVLWATPCGSIHLAHEDDEFAVLAEFAARAPALGIECELLDARATCARLPAANPDGLRGSLFSPAELAIDPRQAIARIPKWLAEQQGVQFRFETTVIAAEPGTIRTAAGDTIAARQTIIASGTDFETLFPAEFRTAGIRKCKLQMLRTPPQPGGWRLGPHVAGGLTLAHYTAFQLCDALAKLKQRIDAEMGDYVRFGIHVMASQNELGEVLIGDSHEYDADISIFDKQQIDNLVLRYLRRMVRLPSFEIAQRWHGLYAKHAERPLLLLEPRPGVTIAAAPGGAGMTMSFGFAQAWWHAREAGKPFNLETA